MVPASAQGVWLRLTALLLFVAAAGVTVAVVGIPDLERLRVQVSGAGSAGPVLFVVGYALATLAPLPKSALSAAGGALFGLFTGTVLVLAAALLGAVIAFGIARLLGRDAVQRIAGGRLDPLDRALRGRGLVAVIVVRLVPVIPFTAVNYGCGVLPVRFRDYLTGTAIGIIPGTVAFVALGRYGTQPGSWQFLAASALLVTLTAGSWIATHRHRRTARAGSGSGSGESRDVDGGPRGRAAGDR